MPASCRLLPAALLLIIAPPPAPIHRLHRRRRPHRWTSPACWSTRPSSRRTDGWWRLGPAATTTVPAARSSSSGRGRTLMPGLIDAHVHMHTADVPAYLASGILTVRNMWGHAGITRLQADIAGWPPQRPHDLFAFARARCLAAVLALHPVRRRCRAGRQRGRRAAGRGLDHASRCTSASLPRRSTPSWLGRAPPALRCSRGMSPPRCRSSTPSRWAWNRSSTTPATTTP